MGVVYYTLLLCLFVTSTINISAGQFITPTLEQRLPSNLMKAIGEAFVTDVKALLNHTANLDEVHSSLNNNVKYKSETETGKVALDSFVNGIEDLFKGKTQVLKNITNTVQTHYRKNSNKEIEKFEYLNMRTIDPDDENILAYDYNFTRNFKVNISDSFVQVPTNIWAYKTHVLNTVEWTKKIDDVFVENFKNSDKKLLYQYYGDSSGVFRIFPGNVMGVKTDGEEQTTDLYDCRRRVWYIQASASPKDIVIVIDMSGSMIGNNIGIARITTSSIIDTLQENDFFNVITVNSKVEYVHPCINYLIQATKENKEMMKKQIQNISAPSNVIDPDLGMEEAFKIFDRNPNVNSTRPTANCSRAIMFITDGVEGEYAAKKTMEKYNADKRVRVFSFLVGRMKGPDKAALVKMSCENRGHYYAIETLGNVWDTVLDYLQVMSRPIASAYDNSGKVKPTYTPAYLDSAGFGMIMSVSISVFNKIKVTDGKETKETHDKLIGVVGTDISLKNLMDKVPQSKLSPFSHGFVINNNGFILIHPKFRKQEGYLPAPPNILLEDLEYARMSNNSVDLKIKMINTIGRDSSTSHSVEFPTYWLYDNNRKLKKTKSKYFYKPVNGTDFVAGMVIVDSNKYLVIDINDTTPEYKELINNGVHALNGTSSTTNGGNDTLTEYTHVKIAQWNYCSKIKPGKGKPKGIINYPDAKELFEGLNNKDIPKTVKDCDTELIQRLLIPAGAVNEATKSWKLINSTVNTIFFATSGGFLKYMTSSTDETTSIGRDVLKMDVFENAVANPSAEIVASAPQRHGKTSSNEAVYVSMMSPTKGPDDIVSSVLGVKVNSDYLNEMFKNATRVNSNDISYPHCPDNTTAFCAIIDQNGFIVASNQFSKYTGRFLGERIGYLVEAMSNKGIFVSYHLKDTQAECQTSDEKSSANFLLTPAKLIINALLLMCKSMYWLVIQLGIFIISLMRPESSNVVAQKPRTIPISCTKDMTFYRIRDSFFTELNRNNFYSGSFSCSPRLPKCRRQKFQIYKIAETNMYFVVLEPDSDCQCFDYKISIDPVRVPDTDKWCSKNPPTFNYRKTPTTCFNSTAKETGNEACGAASQMSISMLTSAIVVASGVLVINIL